MKLSHLFAVAALPLALTACNPDSNNSGGNTDPTEDQNVNAAKASLLELQGLMPLDSVEAKTAQFRLTNRALENLLTNDIANLDTATDVTLLALQQALVGFVEVNDDDPDAVTYQFNAADTEKLAKISDSTLFGNNQLAGSFKLVEINEDETDPDTGDVTTVTKRVIESNNLTVTDIVTANVVSVTLRLALPDAPQPEMTFGIEQLEISSIDTLRKLYVEGENATLTAPLNAAQAESPALAINATYSVEQYTTDFAEENLTTTLASGELTYNADLVNGMLKRTQLSLNGSIGSESALYSLAYQANLASGLKAQLLNAVDYRVGDDASEWLEVENNQVLRNQDSKLSLTAGDISLVDEGGFALNTDVISDGVRDFNWTTLSISETLSYFDKPSYAFEALLTEVNGSPSVTVGSDTYDLTGIGSDLASESSETYLNEAANSTIRIAWDELNSAFVLSKYIPDLSAYFERQKFILDESLNVFSNSTITYVESEPVESSPETLDFEFLIATGENALETKNNFLDKYHDFTATSYLPFEVQSETYTAQVDFDFALDIENESDDIALEADSAKINDLVFYTGTCDFGMECTPVEFNFNELGVAKFQLEQDGVNFVAEEIEGGLFYTLSKDDKNVVVTQNNDNELDILYGVLAIQLNLGDSTTGDVLYNNINVGSVTEVDGQLTVTYKE